MILPVVLAEKACDSTTVFGDQCKVAGQANNGLTHGEKLYTNLKVGNFPTGSCNNNKNNNVFNIVKKYNINFMGLAEHGLNSRELVHSQN